MVIVVFHHPVIGSGSLAGHRASSSEGELLFHLADDDGCL
jgi:hypothetical protein